MSVEDFEKRLDGLESVVADLEDQLASLASKVDGEDKPVRRRNENLGLGTLTRKWTKE